ncbi:MAG: T9SS type A sorting domain-containing protein [Bacteroidetes bacterium]|nr:T9SS type A sorting domain-containing protein [Bacteroidota bacterium]
MTGRVMMQIRGSGATIKLNISELPKGSYLIRLQDGENAFTRRFVKV